MNTSAAARRRPGPRLSSAALRQSGARHRAAGAAPAASVPTAYRDRGCAIGRLRGLRPDPVPLTPARRRARRSAAALPASASPRSLTDPLPTAVFSGVGRCPQQLSARRSVGCGVTSSGDGFSAAPFGHGRFSPATIPRWRCQRSAWARCGIQMTGRCSPSASAACTRRCPTTVDHPGAGITTSTGFSRSVQHLIVPKSSTTDSWHRRRPGETVHGQARALFSDDETRSLDSPSMSSRRNRPSHREAMALPAAGGRYNTFDEMIDSVALTG